jgi:hypothetical protein
MIGCNYRIGGDGDVIVDQTFWVGTYPGLTNDHVVEESIELALAGMSRAQPISCSNLATLR